MSLNVMGAALAGSKAPSRIYTNKKIQDIIGTVLETKPIAIKSPYKRSFKARFSNIYKSDNHMSCYNFCQKCEDNFTTVGAKRPNRIPFTTSFF